MPKRNKGTRTEADLKLGRRLRLARKKMGWTQARLGEKLGVTHQTIQKYETAYTALSVSRLLELCDLMGLNPTILIADLMEDVKSTTTRLGTRRDYTPRVAA